MWLCSAAHTPVDCLSRILRSMRDSGSPRRSGSSESGIAAPDDDKYNKPRRPDEERLWLGMPVSVLQERVGVLAILMVFQSASGMILSRFEDMLQKHVVVTLFLTMLVGAGGNAGNQAAVRIIRGLAVGAVVPGENRGGHQIFNPTSMCAHATVSTQAFPPCFEKSMRAIDPSKNQPNRLRCDRAREFKVWSGRPKPVVDLHAGENGLSFVAREAKMAVVLAVALAAVGFLRARRRRARRARRDVPDGRARARRSPRSPRAPSPRPARSRSPSSSSSR